MPIRRYARSGVAVLAIAMLGCGAGWHRTAINGRQFSPRQQAEVWRQGNKLQWHGVQVTSDSLFGIPYYQSLECDSCRRGVPLTTIDSLRIGDPVAGLWKSVGLVVTGMLVVGGLFAPRD